jgi:phosphoadenosine phosphosulfate reductase
MRSAIETSQWAAEEFGEGLYGLTSFGAESALLFDVLEKSGVEVDFITIDTGFRFPETQVFQEQLINRYKRGLEIYGPTKKDAEIVLKTELWKSNIDEYHEITKREPLRRAIAELGVTALFTGVRAGQTANRATLRQVEPGKDGETRVHPLLGWSEEQANEYFVRHGLPRPPLFFRGYGSIGDWTTTEPGVGREGRELPNQECGLHVTNDGKLIRATPSRA